MKKLLLILFLISFLVEANEFVIRLFPQEEDKYNLSIEGGISSTEKSLRNIFQRKVNEVCGTRFEIVSIELDNIYEEKFEKNVIHGSFKCYVNSQM